MYMWKEKSFCLEEYFCSTFEGRDTCARSEVLVPMTYIHKTKICLQIIHVSFWGRGAYAMLEVLQVWFFLVTS
jgi:hypothetical protein